MAKVEEITLKNTKGEILEALNAALKREKERNSQKSDPVAEVKSKEIKESVKETKINVENNIFSEELTQKFLKLEMAIASEEEKLKELYGVEEELNKLTIAVNAGKDLLLELNSKKELEEKEYKDKIDGLEKEYKDKLEKLENEYKENVAEKNKERVREQEEYSYNLKRDREIDNNKWLDSKQKREEEITAKELEIKKALIDVKEKEDYLKSLEKKVEELPKLLELEYNRGKKEIEEILVKEHKYEMELKMKDYQNIIDRQKDKIESLELNIQTERASNEQLGIKLDNAYKEIKDMATKTVDATGGVKILNNKTANE